MIKIKFKKKYSCDTTWSEILEEFLEHLSEVYGYSIDVFDIQAMPELVVQNRLGNLLNENQNSITITRAFTDQVRAALEKREFVSETRRKAKMCWEAGNLWKEEGDEHADVHVEE